MSNTFLTQHANKLILSSLLVSACLGILLRYVWSQAKAADESLFEQKLNLSLVNLSQNIDARIDSMKLIAKTVANDKHIHTWVESGFAVNEESILIDKLEFLVNEYGLTSASFADKNTHKYWNHEGFLRVLQPEIDTWYFAYLESDETDLISVYQDKNKQRVDLYVNYQQPDGNGLSGIATSFSGVLKMLNTSIFAKYGNIYLVNSFGEIQVYADAEIIETKNLKDMFPNDTVKGLLQPDSTGFVEINQNGSQLLGASYIPSMNWYVVADVSKTNEYID